MSMRTIARSSSNRNSASALASSVLPTPVGPRNRNDPVGRFGSATPERARRTASDTARTASGWPTTRRPSSSSIRSSFWVSPRSEEHTSELQSRQYLVCRLLLEKKILIPYTRCLSLHGHLLPSHPLPFYH